MDTLTRAQYAELGLGLLAESGIGGVTIATACDRLGVTKGSFYHHFSGVADLRAAMLEYWEDVYGRQRPSALDDLPPRQRVDALVDAAVDRNHEIESAVRAWSRTDADAAAAQRRLDDLRIAYTTETLEECGVPRPRAEVLARAGLAMLIGFQSLGPAVDHRSLRAATEEWRALLHGVIDQEAATAGGRRRRGGPAA